MNEIPMNDLLCPGPCIVCGRTNYALSCGGPSICPTCDTGYSGPQLIKAQKQELDKLREELTALLAERDALREALEPFAKFACATPHVGEPDCHNCRAAKLLNATLSEGERG